MAGLRDRQVSGIPLTRETSAVVTLVLAACIALIGYNVWFSFLGGAKELRPWISGVGVLVYIFQCAGRVPAGHEYTQLFFGSYTGISFPAGIYLLPRLPFPLISLLLLAVKSDISKYLGWILEGEVSVESITVKFFAEGLSSDGIRVRLDGVLVFEVVNAAVFLSQKGNSTNRISLQEFLSAETSSHIKRLVIARHTAKRLFQGEYDGSSILTKEITKACLFVQDSGLMLGRAPIVTVTILNERIRESFDTHEAKDMLRENTDELAKAFTSFYNNCPPGTDKNFAMFMFNAGRRSEGLSEINIHMVKF